MLSPQLAPAPKKPITSVGLQWDAPNFSNLHAEAEAPRQITSEAPHPLYGGHRYSSSASLSHSQRNSPKLHHSYTSSYPENFGGGPLSAGTSISAMSSPAGALNPFEDEELLPPLARSRTSSFGSLASSIHSFNSDIGSRSPASLLIQNLPRDLTRREACLMFACANDFLSCELNASAALGPDNIPVSTSIVAYFKNRPAAHAAASALERRTDIFNDISLFPSPRGPWPISVQIISNHASAGSNVIGGVPHTSGPGSVGNGSSNHRPQKSKFTFAGADEYGTDTEISGPYGRSAISAPPSVASNSTSAFAHYDQPAPQMHSLSNQQTLQSHPLRQGPGSNAHLHLMDGTNMSHSSGLPSSNTAGLHDYPQSQGNSMIFSSQQQQQQQHQQQHQQQQHQHQFQHQHQTQHSQNQGLHPLSSMGSHHSSASLSANFNKLGLNDDIALPAMSSDSHTDEPLQPHHSGGPGHMAGGPHRIVPVRRSSAPGRGCSVGPGGSSGDDPSKIVMTYTPTSSAKALSVLQNGGRVLPPANPADQNPPCNTLYVGNLPPDTSEDELKDLFSVRPGYKRLCFRTKANGPMCFVEFEDENYAGMALEELYGRGLSNSVKGGIRLSFSKNPLGVRANRPRAA